MKRVLRVSGFNDYIAVDLQDNKGKTVSTPLYLKKDSPVKVKCFDAEDNKWYKTELTFDGRSVQARDIDIKSTVHGMQWDVPYEELTNSEVYEFDN